jgi:hypothetical protein
MAAETGARPAAFSEKGFYLDEFRGRTLAIAARAEHLRAPAGLEPTLKELEANRTRVVLISTEPEALESLLDTPVLRARAADERGGALETALWRAMREAPRAGLAVEASRPFPAACREIAVRLGISKLVWVDPDGGLLRGDGSRLSFVDLEELRELIRSGGDGRGRAGLLGELEATLEAGVPSINLCALEGVGDELFSYAGSGTLLTRERYVVVRRLGLDDYDPGGDRRSDRPPGGARRRDRRPLHPHALPGRGHRRPPGGPRPGAGGGVGLPVCLRLHHRRARGCLLRAPGLPAGGRRRDPRREVAGLRPGAPGGGVLPAPRPALSVTRAGAAGEGHDDPGAE